MFDTTNRLSKEAVERLLRGEGLKSHSLKFKIVSINKRRARIEAFIADDLGREIAVFLRGDIEEGNDLTILNIDRVFNVTVSA